MKCSIDSSRCRGAEAAWTAYDRRLRVPAEHCGAEYEKPEAEGLPSPDRPRRPTRGRENCDTQVQERPLAVETISSYAHRAGDRIRLVLHLPELEYGGEEITVRFKSPHGAVTGTAKAVTATPGTLLETEVPTTSLQPGIWRLAVQPNRDAGFRRARARLLTSSTQPIALLVGAPPVANAPPKPTVAPTSRQRLAHHAGNALERALAPLPRERAEPVPSRSASSSTSHTALGLRQA